RKNNPATGSGVPITHEPYIAGHKRTLYSSAQDRFETDRSFRSSHRRSGSLRREGKTFRRCILAARVSIRYRETLILLLPLDGMNSLPDYVTYTNRTASQSLAGSQRRPRSRP